MITKSTTRRRALFTAALVAITGGLAIVSNPVAHADSTLPLGNPGTGGVTGDISGSSQCAGLDPAQNYWHFVVVPNSGAGTFLSVTLVLNNGSGNTSFTFTGAQLIPNGSQTDNIFIQVPAGYQVDDIVDGTAVISGTGSKFNLSHTCSAAFQPLTASKTAVGTYDTNFHWTLDKTVDDDSHSGTAGTEAGASVWTITATKVNDPISDIRVEGVITINNANAVAVPVAVADVLNDGTAASVSCPGASVPANGSLVCTYTALPTGITATLNTATIVAGAPVNGTATATAPVSFSVQDVNGDAPVDLTDPHLPGINETISDSDVQTANEAFQCSANAADYTNGEYSYDVPNTAFLDGGSTHLSDSANVHVVCTLPALTVVKTAAGSFDRTIAWTLDKSVDIASFTGVPGQSFLDIWNIDVTRTVTNGNFAVSGTVSITNPSAIPQTFSAVDTLDVGGAVTLDCPSLVVPAGGSVLCTYTKSVTDGSATLNTVVVSAAGNGSVTATAPVAFTGTTIGDVTTDLTDARLPVLDHPLLAAAILLHAPETFTCPAADSILYVNGVYTQTFVNTANLDGVTTHLTDSASVTITCRQARVTGGHTIGYYFNSPTGTQYTLNNRTFLASTYPNVLAGVDLSTAAKIKSFGTNANCSGTCTTLLQAQFIATALQVKASPASYGNQCVAVPTYVDTVDGTVDGKAQIDDLLVGINAKFPTLTTAQRIQLQVLLNSINNDQAFIVC